MSTTYLSFAVDSDEPLPLRTTFQERPPSIIIEFPKRQVIGVLPERSLVSRGAVQALTTQYEPQAGEAAQRGRFIRSVQVVLSAPYAYRVRSESRRVIVEIDHPASVAASAVEVGLRGGTIIGGIGAGPVSGRFRAMQDALVQATPTPWTLQLQPLSNSRHSGTIAPGPGRVLDATSPRAPASHPPVSPRTAPAASPVVLVVLAAALVGLGIGGWLIASRDRLVSWWTQRRPEGAKTRLPSGVVLIDQLVWRAFERQGYQLLIETELTPSPLGTLRVVMKEGVKSALMFVGHGPFFEKQTVERFVRAMREAGVDQGVLVAAGSFTVPAQRIAKEHRVTLIGREQLTELLSTGAGSEYFTRQLEQQRLRLDEAKETIAQLTSELETLRRQRNEASWYLGEERAKAAALEARLEDSAQQLRRYESETKRWEQEAASLKKQWEESQWYLGEAQVRLRHIEAQRSRFDELAARAEAADRGQAEANWYLGEARSKQEALEAQLSELEARGADATQRECALREAVERLAQELRALHSHRERRRSSRVNVPDAAVDLYDAADGAEDPVFSGSPSNISLTGLGIDADRELPTALRARVRLPDCEPLDASVRVVWQQSDTQTGRYHSGCRLIGLSEATKDLINKTVERLQAFP